MTIDINLILEQIGTQAPQTLPPVHLWKPKTVQDIDIRIDRNGRWFHEGDLITRKRIVRLFSTVLVKEDRAYFLVTPVEKCRITVEDVPFLLVSLVDNKKVPPFFVTNTEDIIPIDNATVCQLNAFEEQLLPYIKVRDNLFGRVSRNLYYQLLEMAEQVEENGCINFYVNLNNQQLLIGKVPSV